MATIEVDFDVYKALTVRRSTESVSYNEVIRDLLGISNIPEAANSSRKMAPEGLNYKGVFFPDGTRFRATYKGRNHTGEIKNGAWIDSRGRRHTSPSEAAFGVTGKSNNGWKFWECSRPNDPAWVLIDNLREFADA